MLISCVAVVGRTDLCDSVLNDEFVSVPIGTEDQGNTFRKTDYDEILYQCEDDRHETHALQPSQIHATCAFFLPAYGFVYLSTQQEQQYQHVKVC